MRFMVIVKANKDSEAGVMPSEQLLTEMGKFNEELAKVGVLLAAEGAPSKLQGRAGPVLGRQADRDRRALRRNQGTDRRLLDLAGKIKGRGDRMAQALP